MFGYVFGIIKWVYEHRQFYTRCIELSSEPVSHMFKLVALGDGAVGKTSCIRRYVDNSFSEHYVTTIGTTFSVKTVEAKLPDGTVVNARIVLWDLGGQPSYAELRRRYMAGSSMAIIVYDVTRPQTFLNVGEWFTRFITVCPNAVVAVVANKIDRPDRLVPREAGEMIKRWLDVLHYETSAKTGENIEQMFSELVIRTSQRLRQIGRIGQIV